MAQGKQHNASNFILPKTKFTAEEALRILLENSDSDIEAHELQAHLNVNCNEMSSAGVVQTNKRKKFENMQYSWSNDKILGCCASYEFTGTPGVHPDITTFEPHQLFEYFITDEICDYIVEQTNLYALQSLKEKQLKPKSRFKMWTPVTRDEIRIYIGLILYRGIIWKPTYELYHTTNVIYATPVVRKVIKYDRFRLIDTFIHFVDNSNLEEIALKCAKIKPIHDYLFTLFRKAYVPQRNIAIDESLLLWIGRLSWKQYIPRKVDKINTDNYNYIATSIVMTLMNNLLNKGYCVFINNWYTSVEVCHKLLLNKTDCVGTVRKDRKSLRTGLICKKLQPDEKFVQFEKSTGIMCTKWRDKKDIYLLSTCIKNSIVEVTRSGKPRIIPAVVDLYTKNMGGVDQDDQMLTTYISGRKRVKKWIIDYIFLTYVDQTKNLKARGCSSVNANPMRLVERHFPSIIPPNPMGETPSRRCAVCSANKIRADTRYMCIDCDVGLCVNYCFKHYHTSRDLKINVL
ncbi:piggyBac transposable element-derived protein 4-like [Hydra vulgaris]|uniref:PiggyBac transposable element-derived protein 4-like n=1 Tax=Hydra vulgaris TaxID=6087 RepID=A0ABM4CS35_HYDVU